MDREQKKGLNTHGRIPGRRSDKLGAAGDKRDTWTQGNKE